MRVDFNGCNTSELTVLAKQASLGLERFTCDHNLCLSQCHLDNDSSEFLFHDSTPCRYTGGVPNRLISLWSFSSFGSFLLLKVRFNFLQQLGEA